MQTHEFDKAEDIIGISQVKSDSRDYYQEVVKAIHTNPAKDDDDLVTKPKVLSAAMINNVIYCTIIFVVIEVMCLFTV